MLMTTYSFPPSELLTLDEVMKIAEECGKRREMYKVLILVLFESCARRGELLNLKLGDVTFSARALLSRR